MTGRQATFWSCAAVTAVVYGAMLLVTLPELSRQAGGLVPIDLHAAGYDAEVVAAFRDALSPAGHELYAGTQRALDTAFPLLLAVCLVLAIPETFRSPRARAILLALTFGGMIADLAENVMVGRMMVTEGPVNPGLAAWACRMTIIKFAMSSTAVAVVVGKAALDVLKNRRSA